MSPTFRSALLLAGALAASLAVLGGCSAPTDGGGDDVALGDDELNAVNNKMGLRLRYDEPTGRVHATLGTKLRPGEKLQMRVRRGRLSNDSQSVLDCSLLTDAVPAAPTTAANKTVFVGPELDRSLLACVYNEQWIEGNLSPPVLERLSRDGADAIVDACIVKDQGARARLQTSLQYAWDTTDPNVNPALVPNH